MSKELQLTLWVGIGCQRGVSKALIELAIAQVFQAYNLPESAIVGVATIDTKANEPGILQFYRDYSFGELRSNRQLILKFFSSDQLSAIPVLHPSKLVESKVNTSSVAEAAAILAAGALIVPKQIIRKPGESGAVTIAVAKCLSEIKPERVR